MKLQEAGARFAGQAGWQESSTMGQDRLPFSVLRAGVSPYGPGWDLLSAFCAPVL